ncbi:MAG: hypothetical protein R3213_07585, partial [Flavobacteriaceae bacterium]|nr:hypothetical protein [Flavobacteriaceae bacterium]
LSQNYLAKIENDQIKSKFSEFSEMVKWIDMVDGYTINQHQTTIEPFLVENFNYSEIAMDLGDEVFFGGGPSSRIDNLWDNLKLWNVISIKLETWEYEKAALAWGLEILQTLRNLIAKELKISDER